MSAGKKSSRVVTKKAAKASQSGGGELAAVVGHVLERLPGAGVTMKLHNASFTVGKNVFAFTRPDAVVMKLPAERVAELVEQRGAQPLKMGKRVMKEWVVMQYVPLEECVGDVALLKEAMRFVASLRTA